MKRKMYTLSHRIDLLEKVDNGGRQFTADEHAYVMEREFGKTVFGAKENLLRYYLWNNPLKLSALGFLINFVGRSKCRNILSLGAGECVLEYLLKLSLPEESQVVACDFDSFFMKKAKEYFPEIISCQFNFFEDEIESLQIELNINFDLVVFFGSTYVMDDASFSRLFKDLKKIGVPRIIDFYAGYMDMKSVCLQPLRMVPIVRRLLRRPLGGGGNYRGKFHGYSRSRSELRNLYASAGWKILKEMSISVYKYASILEPSSKK
ncbi:MAG: hypothetical protein ABFD66_06390 [Smithella sp.]